MHGRNDIDPPIAVLLARFPCPELALSSYIAKYQLK
jgi:hypothetical protein